MNTCPVCQEQFEDELRFCTFDGARLRGGASTATGPRSSQTVIAEPVTYYGSSYERGRNGWRIAFFLLLALVLTGTGIGTAYLLMQKQTASATTPAAPERAVEAKSAELPAAIEPVDKPSSLAALTRQELMEKLPNNLLRRFHAGEPGQGIPDDLRIIASEKGEYVVMLGSGHLEGSSRTPVERILILKRGEDDFRDATRELLPSSYGSGSVGGRGAQVKFDEGGNNIVVREPKSSSSIVHQCASCDHAYQLVTLHWKNGRYLESARVWENDRYTVFYVVADALEKKKVDGRARPFIENALDPIIAEGFSRSGKDAWTVEWHGEEGAETGGYELANSFDRLLITVSRVNGQWKAVQIED